MVAWDAVVPSTVELEEEFSDFNWTLERVKGRRVISTFLDLPPHSPQGSFIKVIFKKGRVWNKANACYSFAQQRVRMLNLPHK